MSVAALAPGFEADAPAASAQAILSDMQHDPHLYITIGRMLDFCNQRPMSEPFTARGIVIDTTSDIAAQLRDFFPSNIDLTPVIDRMVEVCTERARATGQYLQVLSFDHLKQIKPIESDEGNLETFIEVFADRRVKLSQYTGIKTALKAGGGGSGGGDPNQMLAEIRQADIQGFGLQIKSLDISDAKATELLGKMGIAQAFGGDGAAIGGALETLAKGGPEAKALQAVIEQIVEIKTLRTAMTNAPDTAAAQPIAAALAIKTEALSAQVQTIQATTPQVATAIKANIAQTVEGVKTTLVAHQIEVAVTQLSTALPASMVRVANDLGRNTMSVQVARAAAAVQTIARTNNLTVREVVALVLTKNAPPSMTQAVSALTTIMAKPEFLPTLEKGISPKAALTVREALTMPVLQGVVAAPTPIASVARAVQVLAEKSGTPTITAAAAVLNIGGQKVAVEAVAPSLRVPQLQMVVENLQAVAMTRAVPATLKPELASVTAQVQALAVQMRSPEPSVLPTTPQPLPPQAPLAAIAQVLDIKTPAQMPAPMPSIVEFKGAPNHWGESPNAASARPMAMAPQAPAANQPQYQQPAAPTPPAQQSPFVQPTAPTGVAPATPAIAPTQTQTAVKTDPVAAQPVVAPAAFTPVQAAPAQAQAETATIKVNIVPPAEPVATAQQPQAPQAKANDTPVAPQTTAQQPPVQSQPANDRVQPVENNPVQQVQNPRAEAPRAETPRTEAPHTDTVSKSAYTVSDTSRVSAAREIDRKAAATAKDAKDNKDKPTNGGCGDCNGSKGCCPTFNFSAEAKEKLAAEVKQATREVKITGAKQKLVFN